MINQVVENLLNKFWPRKSAEVKAEGPPLRRFKIKTRQEVNGFWQDVDAQFETNAPEKSFSIYDGTGFGMFGYHVYYFDKNAVVFDQLARLYGTSPGKNIESLSVEDFYKNHIRDNARHGMYIDFGGPITYELIFRQVGAQ